MMGLTNTEIEEAAIEYVKGIYPKAERVPHGSGYDLKIGDRIIEVKGTTSNNYKHNIFFSRNKEYEAWDENKDNYWLFRVINVGSKNIKLIEISGKDIEPISDPRWRIKVRPNLDMTLGATFAL